MKKLIFTLSTLMLLCQIYAQTGTITVTSVAQRSDGSGLVDVYFNLDGPVGSYFMSMRVSFDAGQNYYSITGSSISGDTGPISAGYNKHIVWNPTIDHPNRYSPQTKLLVKAYSLESGNSCQSAPTVTDFDGNVYNTVQIGNQCWMASNLNTTRTATGILINRYCYSGFTCEPYGGLYTWSTAINGATSSNNNPSGVQGICPNGWHLPSDAEWTQLIDYLINNYIDITGSNVGNKLKSCRQASSPLGGECNTSDHPRWNLHPTHYGTNDFGFSALPGGSINNGVYNYLGSIGYWWSTTEAASTTALRYYMSHNIGGVYKEPNIKSDWNSVRCLRD